MPWCQAAKKFHSVNKLVDDAASLEPDSIPSVAAIREKRLPQSSEAGHSPVSSQCRSCSSVSSTPSPLSTSASALRSSASCLGDGWNSRVLLGLVRGATAFQNVARLHQ